MEQPRPTGPRQAGLSIVEILATVAVVVLLATVAVPNYFGSRVTANESAVVTTLRSVAAAQVAFRRSGAIDRDGDGIGEFGTIKELDGSAALAGTTERIRTPLLAPEFGRIGGTGRASQSGYWFALHLPDASGLGIAGEGPRRLRVDPELAERHWTCIAWPHRHGATGVHTYFVNESGEVRSNRSARYSGTVRVPPAGAALVGAATAHHVAGARIATNEVAADGQVWVDVE